MAFFLSHILYIAHPFNVLPPRPLTHFNCVCLSYIYALRNVHKVASNLAYVHCEKKMAKLSSILSRLNYIYFSKLIINFLCFSVSLYSLRPMARR